MKQKLFTLFLALVASVGTMFASTQVDGIWYDFDNTNNTATVTYCGVAYGSYNNEYSGSVVIPSSVTYNGVVTYSVTSIGGSAFRDCSSLTSVTIPNSVTSIGGYAFKDCTGLTSVSIGNSVTNIGGYAFSGCSSLTSITIPNSVTSIGDETFYGCSSLTSVTIPNSVTSIGDYAFFDCKSLTSITIPNSVTSIGDYAFYNCKSLTSITIPNSVISIGYNAFCNVLNIEYHGTATGAPWGARVMNGYVEGNLVYEDSTKTTLLFCSYSAQGEIIIPNTVTNIREGAFSDCTSLTSVTIPNSVTSIGSSTFAYCTSLTSVTIPNSVTSIGEGAFSGCYSLTSITIPNSVTSIGTYTFSRCSSLASINVDANNANYCSIDGVLFSKDKTTLIQYPIGNTRSEYIIPNSVTSIGVGAFGDCDSLTSVTIPNSVTSIGVGAFGDCDSLTSVTIPNSVTSIEIYTFTCCKSLNSVTIPNSVTSIEYAAFGDCDSLTSVINYATQPQAIDERAFWEVDLSPCQLYVPSTSVGLYQTAEVWKKFGDIQPIRAEDITDVSETIITPSENEVEITWPSVNGAATYELVIKDKDGNIVCTLIFNANGQLTSIAFNAPSRNGVPAQTQSAGFSFTITGLDSGTGYDLTLTAKDNSGNIIEETTIPFHTNWPEGIENVQGDEVQSTKVIKDGQVLILRNGKTYTMQGQEVK